MIKAVIFDMDGLLINSEPVWFRARKELLKDVDYNWTWDNQKQTMGVSTKAWVDYMYNLVNKTLTKEDLLKGVTDRMKLYYNKGEIELMPGANEALKFAKENYKVGLASGSYKDLLYSAVKVNNWEDVFDEILSSDDMERGKPNPDVYLEVIKRLGVEPNECFVLEDSPDGIRAGVAAGTNTIAVPSKEIAVPNEVLLSAFAVIDSLLEFPEVVSDFNKR